MSEKLAREHMKCIHRASQTIFIMETFINFYRMAENF